MWAFRGGGGGEGLKLVGGNVFGRCARAPVPGWRIGSPGSQARAPENTATNQFSRRSSHHFRIVMASFWHHFRIILTSFWHHFRIILASFWYHSSRVRAYPPTHAFLPYLFAPAPCRHLPRRHQQSEIPLGPREPRTQGGEGGHGTQGALPAPWGPLG